MTPYGIVDRLVERMRPPERRRRAGLRRTKSLSLPLSGIAVLDLTRILSGPFCTMKLGDMGADVIKIEQPGNGDETRKWGPPFINGESAYFLSVNRNKLGMTLDLKSEEGKAILKKLVRKSDVLVENFRAGVMKSLGFDYAAVKKINPGIVYCSISGYGQTSSRSHHPSYDLIVQGESGLMDVTGSPDGTPTKVGISLADVSAGNIAFEGILLSLYQRSTTGKGQHVDISLLDAIASLFTYQTQMALSTGQPTRRMGNRHPTITPYETYSTKNGFINVAVGSEPAWMAFCGAIGRPDLAIDERFAVNALRVKNRRSLERILIPILKKRRAAEWLGTFRKHDVPAGSINTISEMLLLPAIDERRMILTVDHPLAGKVRMIGNPIKLSRATVVAKRPPPRLGEHTQSILDGLGYSKSRIVSLKERRVV